MASFQAFIIGGSWRTHLLGNMVPVASPEPLQDLPHPEIEADRNEAWACHLSGQHKAAVIMARSALQRAVRVLNPYRGSLNQELDNLAANGIITRQLRANADEVRLSGNDVAHPEELGEVTADDAEDSLTFLDDFIGTTLMIPERQRQRQARREEPAPESPEIAGD